MENSNEPKKETVRITVSPQPISPPPAPAESGDTVRIHLPTRPPTNPPPAPADSPSPARGAAAAMPAVQMKKTQPLIDLPVIETPSTTVTLTPRPQLGIDQMPMPLCWALLA